MDAWLLEEAYETGSGHRRRTHRWMNGCWKRSKISKLAWSGDISDRT